MNLDDLSVKEFSQQLAGKVPVPGGGGAAALVASLGAALSSMVGNYSIGKSSDDFKENELNDLLKKSESVRQELLQCINDDAAGFEPLSNAYKLDKNYPGRDEIMEKCLIDAALTPLRIAKLSCEVISLSKEFALKGSELMLSDAACSAVLGWSSLYAAVINVKVNTKLMKNRILAEEMNQEVDSLMNTYWKIADEVYESVYEKLK